MNDRKQEIRGPLCMYKNICICRKKKKKRVLIGCFTSPGLKRRARKADPCIIFNRPWIWRPRHGGFYPRVCTNERTNERVRNKKRKKERVVLVVANGVVFFHLVLLFLSASFHFCATRDKGGMTRSQRPVKRWSLLDNVVGESQYEHSVDVHTQKYIDRHFPIKFLCAHAYTHENTRKKILS